MKLWQDAFAAKGIGAQAVDFRARRHAGRSHLFYDEKKNWSVAGVRGQDAGGGAGRPWIPRCSGTPAPNGSYESSPWKDEPCHVNCDCGTLCRDRQQRLHGIRRRRGFREARAAQRRHGFGLERLLAASENTPDVFKTSAFSPVIARLESASGKTYGADDATTRAYAHRG